jgi:hypothetical protein
MRRIVLIPFENFGCLLFDLILLSTIASIRLKLLFRLGRSSGCDIKGWLEGVVVMAIGAILRTVGVARVGGAGAKARAGADFLCFFGFILHPFGWIEGHDLRSLHLGVIVPCLTCSV